MSSLSVKPDKCAILQETVNQIRLIKEQEAEAGNEAVQQGEVSSSKPTILANDILGPLLLEALEGFLFVVNPEGRVEYVTENVSQFIRFRKDEVLGNSIYNYLHHGDHGRFSSSLLPTTAVGLIVSQQQQQQQQPTRNRAFNCRFLIKPPDDTDETMEEKQQRVSKYENMQISSTQLPYPGGGGSGGSGDSGEVGPCLMCVARRIPPNEKHLGSPLEQFTIKLDTLGNVVGIDTSGVSSAYSQFLNKDLMNKSIKDLCHRHDRSKLNSHVNEVVASGQSISAIYRLRVSLAQEKYIHVQAKSKLFKGTCSPHDNDFIMSTHSILGEAASPLGLGGSQSSGGGGGGSVGGAGGSSVGGPLLSNLNGSGRGNSGVTSSELSASPSMNSSAAVAFSTGVTLSNSDLGFEFVDLFPSSTWDTMMTGGGDGGGQVSSPAPPSTPSFAPTPSSFPFSPLQDGPTADVKEEVSSEVSVESARLRNLLMTKRPSTDTQHHHHHQRNNKHNILKGLLNQEDDDSHHHHAPSTANNMLLKLLNEKSDDDDVEARAGLKKQNELLQQLLKEDEKNDDPLFKNLVFRTSGGSPGSGGNNSMDSVGRARKRPSEEGDDSGGGVGTLLDSLPPSSGAGSNPGGGSSTSSGGNSKLWEKNKMLASLLAKQPSTPATIPPIPASVISATPQDKLPRLIKQSQSTEQQQQQSQQQQQQQQQIALRLGQQQQQVAQQQLGSALRQTVVPTATQQQSWDSSDPVLSDLLDQVIETLPETVAAALIINMMNSIDSPNSSGSSTSFQQDLNEKMAINAIQKSLMQCETAVKSPAYTTTATFLFPLQLGQQGQQQFTPPPMYPQRQRFPIQGPLAGRQPNHQFSLANQQQQQKQRLMQAQQQQQQQQKQRLLQQQQQQQLLIPSNAAVAAASASTGDPAAIHNIDSLINNTVAPNVSLQRSGSVPDSQLSPVGVGGFGGTGGGGAGGSSVSPGQRQPYSPQPFSPVNGGINSFQSTTGQQGAQQARLSPSGLPNFQQAQLSPRVSQN
ncbi:hypothetical protein AAG570_002046 [Ranatra chinensis]|uniref:PAS domain-containing protein n=1 Tax=Ranatra chinensis TaxID=642074 RepID=A0ABD0YAA1_9HEMI